MPFPAIPQNMQVQQGNGEVLVTWDIVAGSTSYTIQRSTDNVNFSTLSTPDTNSYLDASVSVNTQYWYRVAATNGSGTGSYTTSQNIIPTRQGDMSLGELRLRAKQRADRENSNFVSDTEWNSYINQSYFELYDMLTTLFEDYYVAAPVLITTDGSTQQYDLPDGVLYSGAKPFYKMLGLDMGLSQNTNAWVSVHKFDFIQRNRYVYPNLTSTYFGVFNLRYRVFGNKLFMIPTPSAGQYLRLWYIPRMDALLQDTDVADGVSGWTEYIIVDAAIKALQKEESDVTVLAMQKQALMDRIQSTAMNRDAGQPDTISNVRSTAEQWGGFGSPNGDGSFGGY